MNGLISVVIPVYDPGEYLPVCLDSVLSQTYKDLELILVDDGSTDGSAEVCDAYALRDDRIKVIHKANGGASSARNAGLDAASGEYVYCLDSDDRIMPDMLEKLAADAERNSSDIVFFDAHTVDCATGKMSDANYSHREKYLPASGRDMMWKCVENGDFHMGAALSFYRRGFLERIGLRFTEGIVYEDFLFACVAYCLAERVSYVPEYLYFRLDRPGSVMTAKKTMKNFTSAETVYYGVRDFSEANGGIVPPKYIARGAYNVLNCAEALSAKDKKLAALSLKAVKSDVLAHKGYGDPALRMRCIGGKPLWAARRAVQKVTGK